MAEEIKQFLAHGRGIGLSGYSAIAPFMPRFRGGDRAPVGFSRARLLPKGVVGIGHPGASADVFQALPGDLSNRRAACLCLSHCRRPARHADAIDPAFVRSVTASGRDPRRLRGSAAPVYGSSPEFVNQADPCPDSECRPPDAPPRWGARNGGQCCPCD